MLLSQHKSLKTAGGAIQLGAVHRVADRTRAGAIQPGGYVHREK